MGRTEALNGSPPSSSQRLKPRGDVYSIPEHVALLLDDVAEMNTNTDMNLFSFFLVGIVCPQLRVNRLCALHGMDHRGEVHQEGIAHGLDDMAVMLSDSLLNDLVMDG